MSTLVVGAGMVGSQALRQLVRRGERPLAYELAPNEENIEGLAVRIDLMEGDVRDLARLVETLRALLPGLEDRSSRGGAWSMPMAISPFVIRRILSVPLVQALAAQFHEVPPSGGPVGPGAGRPPAASYGNNLAPLGAEPPFGATSPVFRYPCARSRESLEAMARACVPDAAHGWKMKYLNPLTGGHAMPTMGAFLQKLPAGFKSVACRSTDGAVYSVAEGRGRVKLGDAWQEFEPRDHFVVPSWTSVAYEAQDDCVLFSFSDRAAQEALGLWRERRG